MDSFGKGEGASKRPDDIVPKTELTAYLIMLEVFLGYIMLGGLISIMANKVAKRA